MRRVNPLHTSQSSDGGKEREPRTNAHRTSSASSIVKYAAHKNVGGRLVMEVREFHSIATPSAQDESFTGAFDSMVAVKRMPPSLHSSRGELSPLALERTHGATAEVDPLQSISETRLKAFANMIKVSEESRIEGELDVKINPVTLTFSRKDLEDEYKEKLRQTMAAPFLRALFAVGSVTLCYTLINMLSRNIPIIVTCLFALFVMLSIFLGSRTKPGSSWRGFLVSWASLYFICYMSITVAYALDGNVTLPEYNIMAVYVFHAILRSRIIDSFGLVLSLLTSSFVTMATYCAWIQILENGLIMIVMSAMFVAVQFFIERIDRVSFLLQKRVHMYKIKIEKEKKNIESILESIYPSIIASELMHEAKTENIKYVETRAVAISVDFRLLVDACERNKMQDSLERFISDVHTEFSRFGVDVTKESRTRIIAVCGLLREIDDAATNSLAAISSLLQKLPSDTLDDVDSPFKVFFTVAKGELMGIMLENPHHSFEVFGDAMDAVLDADFDPSFPIRVDANMARSIWEHSVGEDMKRLSVEGDEAAWIHIDLLEFPHLNLDFNPKPGQYVAKQLINSVLSKDSSLTGVDNLANSQKERTSTRSVFKSRSKQRISYIVYVLSITVGFLIVGAFDSIPLQRLIETTPVFVYASHICRFGVLFLLCIGAVLCYTLGLYESTVDQAQMKTVHSIPTFLATVYVAFVCVKLGALLLIGPSLLGSHSELRLYFFEAHASIMAYICCPTIRYPDYRRFISAIVGPIHFALYFFYTPYFRFDSVAARISYCVAQVIVPITMLGFGSQLKDRFLEDESIARDTLIKDSQNVELQRAFIEKIVLSCMPRDTYIDIRNGKRNFVQTFDQCACIVITSRNLNEILSESPTSVKSKILNEIREVYSRGCTNHNIVLVKTTGSKTVFLCFDSNQGGSVALRAAKFSQEVMADLWACHVRNTGQSLDLRITIGYGTCHCGITGNQKISYDVWGPCESQASSLSRFAIGGRIEGSSEFVRACAKIPQIIITYQKINNTSHPFIEVRQDFWKEHASSLIDI
eukprot:TRINITY_DN3608_c0_g1_i3.p1 TRINITY_DN3608_c0_g1~~TRINITY_DN3608_c0_g1_i3.p1  ORF type:complete len:1039 (+),score=133.37 TRINITY_DN3608_c0_g1_i3:113-3229(+)